jgi:hypothetical protein
MNSSALSWGVVCLAQHAEEWRLRTRFVGEDAEVGFEDPGCLTDLLQIVERLPCLLEVLPISDWNHLVLNRSSVVL